VGSYVTYCNNALSAAGSLATNSCKAVAALGWWCAAVECAMSVTSGCQIVCSDAAFVIVKQYSDQVLFVGFTAIFGNSRKSWSLLEYFC